MNGNYYRKINLAGLTINVFVDGSFKNIRSFMDKFTDVKPEKEDKEFKVLFSKGKRGVTLLDRCKSLSITGDSIDDLFNPFNKILVNISGVVGEPVESLARLEID